MWTESKAGTRQWPAWDSVDGDWRIVDCSAIRTGKPFRLISFTEDDDEGNPKLRDFATLQEAKDFAYDPEPKGL